jgi:hypothetical protein
MRILKLALTPLLLLLSFGQAYADDNVEIMKKLYTKLGQIVRVGENVPGLGTNFLVLANPGILLDPNIKADTIRGAYQLGNLVDPILLPHWIYDTKTDTTFKLYRDILDVREVPIITPTPTEQKAYEDAKKKILDDTRPSGYTKQFETYQTAALVLAQAQDDIKTFQNGNPFADIPNVYWVKLQQAQQNYNLIGNADELDSAQEVMKSYHRIDPNLWWADRRTQFARGSGNFSGQAFPKYDFYPDYAVWLDPKVIWTNLTINNQQIEQTTSSSHTSVGGGLSGGWGLWSFSASGSFSKDTTYFKLNGKTYTMTFEISRVDINRPWLEGSVFESNAWRWRKGNPARNKLISDGSDALAGKTAGDVYMPFLPVALLLARNVTLTGDWTDKLDTTVNTQTSGGGSIGWGPFQFGGSTNSSTSDAYKNYKISGNSITMTSPQIIGFFVQTLPVSPNPDLSAYTWPPEGAPLDEMINARRAERQRLLSETKSLLNLRAVQLENQQNRFEIQKNQLEKQKKEKK